MNTPEDDRFDNPVSGNEPPPPEDEALPSPRNPGWLELLQILLGVFVLLAVVGVSFKMALENKWIHPHNEKEMVDLLSAVSLELGGLAVMFTVAKTNGLDLRALFGI